MKRTLTFALALLILANSPAFALSVRTATWAQCTQDSDCVTVSGPCGEDRAVNRNHAEEMRKIWLEEGRRISCEVAPDATDTSHRPEPACHANACIMK